MFGISGFSVSVSLVSSKVQLAQYWELYMLDIYLVGASSWFCQVVTWWRAIQFDWFDRKQTLLPATSLLFLFASDIGELSKEKVTVASAVR